MTLVAGMESHEQLQELRKLDQKHIRDLVDSNNVLMARISDLEAMAYNVKQKASKIKLSKEAELIKTAVDEAINKHPRQSLIEIQARNLESLQPNADMKAQFIGEFTWQEEEAVFHENGEKVEYTATYTVPWTVTKDIREQMNAFAVKQLRGLDGG